MPVGINALCKGFNDCGVSRLALMSIPDDPLVAYPGNGFEEVFMIFISIDFMVANIKVR